MGQRFEFFVKRAQKCKISEALGKAGTKNREGEMANKDMTSRTVELPNCQAYVSNHTARFNHITLKLLDLTSRWRPFRALCLLHSARLTHAKVTTTTNDPLSLCGDHLTHKIHECVRLGKKCHGGKN